MACITPFAKRDVIKGWQYFPCGKCQPCLKRRVSGWSYRLKTEGDRAISSLFVTLTYDKKYNITRRGFKTLSVRDVQLFFKRLRKENPKTYPSIRYYVVGEYGSKNWRPHYHIILFNSTRDAVERAWSINGVKIGYVDFGEVSGASIGYCLKYMSKPLRVPAHANDDRLPEFSLMSKGLGSNHLTPAMIKWHKDDLQNRMHIVIEDGKKIAMPRYYKDKIYTEQERKIIAHFAKISNEENEFRLEQKKLQVYGESWYSIKIEQHQETFRRVAKDYFINRKNYINHEIQDPVQCEKLSERCGTSIFGIIDSARQGYVTSRDDQQICPRIACIITKEGRILQRPRLYARYGQVGSH